MADLQSFASGVAATGGMNDQAMDAKLQRFKQRIEQCQDLNKLRTYSYRVQRMLEKYEFYHDMKRQQLKFWEPLLTPDQASSHLRKWMDHRAPSVKLFRTNMTSNRIAHRANMTAHDRADRAANMVELDRAQRGNVTNVPNVPNVPNAAPPPTRESNPRSDHAGLTAAYRSNLPMFRRFDDQLRGSNR